MLFKVSMCTMPNYYLGCYLGSSYQEDGKGLAISGKDDKFRDTTGECLGTLVGTLLELAVIYAIADQQMFDSSWNVECLWTLGAMLHNERDVYLRLAC